MNRALLVLPVLALTACVPPNTGPAGNPAPPQQQAPAEVTYEVTGTGTAQNITYGGNGGTSQQTNATLPWTVTDPAPQGFGFYSLTAMNGTGAGEIRCRIKIGERLLVENVSSGQYAVVSCSGTS